jgi:hypothetical protein
VQRRFPAAFLILILGVCAARGAFALDDQNCSDFQSQAAAQAHLRAKPSDPDGLDGNIGPADGNDHGGGDGIACEHNPSPFDLIPVRLHHPHGASHQAAESGALPFTGPPRTLPMAAIALMLLALGATLLWTTRHRAGSRDLT